MANELEVKYDNPDHDAGVEFSVGGAFIVANGEWTEVTEDQQQDFANLQGKSVREALEATPYYTVKGRSANVDVPEFSAFGEVAPEAVEQLQETALQHAEEVAAAEQTATATAPDEQTEGSEA